MRKRQLLTFKILCILFLLGFDRRQDLGLSMYICVYFIDLCSVILNESLKERLKIMRKKKRNYMPVRKKVKEELRREIIKKLKKECKRA